MNTIKFNNDTFQVLSYNKTTSLNNNNIVSSGYCEIIGDDISAVQGLFEVPITTIQIYHDNELIYNLENLDAQVQNTNEYLSNNQIHVNINFTCGNYDAEESDHPI